MTSTYQIPRERQVVHFDMDTFFVSVERLLDPGLMRRPVIVGGNPNERGVVAGCSYEARQFGVRSAMPLRSAYRLCPNGIFLRGHYRHYAEYSHLVTEILTDIAPLVEKASVDEFYLDLSGCERLHSGTYRWAQEIRKTVTGETRLPVSFGHASNKLVAKVATTQIAKQTTDRHFRVKNGDERGFLAPFPVRAMPGIGEVTSDTMNDYGLERIGQIAITPLPLLVRLFGKSGKTIHEHSNGIDLREVRPYNQQQSVSRESTFAEDTFEVQTVFAQLHALATELAAELRSLRFFARKLTVKLRYSDFHTVTKSVSVEATNAERIVADTSERLLRQLWTRRIRIRLVGIEATDLLEDIEQLYLFADEGESHAIDAVLDSIRTKYGQVIRYAVEGIH